MSIAKIQKSIFNGDVTVPASKSVAHRALICSFLAGGGTVKPIISSKDMQATVGIIEALKNNETELNSIESGSTLRFMIPVAAALGKEVQGRAVCLHAQSVNILNFYRFTVLKSTLTVTCRLK